MLACGQSGQAFPKAGAQALIRQRQNDHPAGRGSHDLERPANRAVPLQGGVAPEVSDTSSLYTQCLTTRNLLMDLELLAHADYFVGTSKSGLTPIIEVRAPPKEAIPQ